MIKTGYCDICKRKILELEEKTSFLKGIGKTVFYRAKFVNTERGSEETYNIICECGNGFEFKIERTKILNEVYVGMASYPKFPESYTTVISNIWFSDNIIWNRKQKENKLCQEKKVIL